METEGLVKLLHLRVHHLTDSLSIAGYGSVPPTYSLIKDWERLDGDPSTVPERSYQACSSERDRIVPVDAREWLDMLRNGRHAGSRSVRRFIEQHAPPLTLHGHIHESHHITKEFMDRIGNTICVNAGQTEDILHAVIIDIPEYTVQRV